MSDAVSITKTINSNRPFSWLDKERQRRISDELPPRRRPSAIAAYATLALFANDSGDRIFDVWLTQIREATGLSKNTLTRALLDLRMLGLVQVGHTTRPDGRFGRTRIELTKGHLRPFPVSTHESGSGRKEHPDATPENEMASESHAHRSQLEASKVGRTSKNKEQRTKKPPTPNGLAGLDPLPHDADPQTAPTPTPMPVPVQLSERLTALAFQVMKDHHLYEANPQIGMTKVRAMVAQFEEEMTFRAMEWASRNASRNPISLAEIKLREGNHPWESEPPPREAPSRDPVRAMVESQVIYQELMSNRHSTDPEYRQRCLKESALRQAAPELLPQFEKFLAMGEFEFVRYVLEHLGQLPVAIPTGA